MYGFGDLDGWLKFIHVIASVIWVGGAALMVIFGASMAGRSQERRLQYAEMGRGAGRIFSIAGGVVLIAGVWLVARVPAWEYSQAWISIGFLGVAAGVVLGMGFYAPQTRALITATAENSPAAEAISRRIGVVATAELALLLVVVWAMVFKPGL